MSTSPAARCRRLVAAVNALGEPGIIFNREPERLYPQTAMAGHILGWTNMDGRGVAGMERVLEERLTAPATRGEPVALAIDSRVQATMEAELAAAVAAQQAEGGTGIVLDVATGEVVAMASAPTFNPNTVGQRRPQRALQPGDDGRLRAGLDVQADHRRGGDGGRRDHLDERSAGMPPRRCAVGRFRISDDHPLGRAITVPEILVHSSNIATARIADQMGQERMQAAFRAARLRRARPYRAARARRGRSGRATGAGRRR